MKNSLLDLNNHLFAQMERLSDEDLKGDELVEEIERAKSVTTVSKEIISNGQLILNAEKTRLEYGIKTTPLLLGKDNAS